MLQPTKTPKQQNIPIIVFVSRSSDEPARKATLHFHFPPSQIRFASLFSVPLHLNSLHSTSIFYSNFNAGATDRDSQPTAGRRLLVASTEYRLQTADRSESALVQLAETDSASRREMYLLLSFSTYFRLWHFLSYFPDSV